MTALLLLLACRHAAPADSADSAPWVVDDAHGPEIVVPVDPDDAPPPRSRLAAGDHSATADRPAEEPGCPEPTRWFPDADGDGFGEMPPTVEVVACDPPPGYTVDRTDCDDSDPAINPNGVDLPGDGIDSDCDGMDVGCVQRTSSPFDRDCDDWDEDWDCDDRDPSVNPDAADVPNDGLDSNCDGVD